MMTRATLTHLACLVPALALCASVCGCAPADAPMAQTSAATTSAAPVTPDAPKMDLQSHDADFEQGLTGSNEAGDVAYVAARNDWSYTAVALRRTDGQLVCMAGQATAQEDGGTTHVTITDEITGATLGLALTSYEPPEGSAEPPHTTLAVDTYPDFSLSADSGHVVAVQIHQMARLA